MTIVKELCIPPAVKEIEESREILRAWTTSTGQHFSMLPGAWKDPAGWGLLFVDVARQVANAYAQGDNGKYIAVLERIKSGIDAEWEEQTDVPRNSKL